jgi:malonyl CoA-acyl carrier protein transacylase
MIADGASKFVELGPGSALIGMIKKINAEVEAVKE